jgi:hypothetical protein
MAFAVEGLAVISFDLFRAFSTFALNRPGGTWGAFEPLPVVPVMSSADMALHPVLVATTCSP